MVTIFGSLLNTLGIRRVDLGREEVTEAGPMVEREFLVPNMVCEGCAEKIEGALSSLPGVRDVTLSAAVRA